MYQTSRILLVYEIMSFPVITVMEEDSIKKIAEKMTKYDIAAVVVTNKDKEPVGVVTQGDIIRKVLVKSIPLTTKAKDIMSKPIVGVLPNTRVEDAVTLMANRGLKRLCVIDENRKLVGIVTDNDIMKNASYLIGMLNSVISTGYEKDEDDLEA